MNTKCPCPILLVLTKLESKDDGAVCRLGIPNSLLEWMLLQRHKCKFSDMINKSFSHQEMMLNGCARVEECLRIQAHRSYNRIKSSSRRKKDRVKNQEFDSYEWTSL